MEVGEKDEGEKGEGEKVRGRWAFMQEELNGLWIVDGGWCFFFSFFFFL